MQNRKEYTETIIVPKSTAEIIERYLNATDIEDMQEEDYTISYTAVFPDKREMDIKCCGGDDEPSWTEAVLFDENGNEICHSDPEDEFFGTWELETDDAKYIVNVEPES